MRQLREVFAAGYGPQLVARCDPGGREAERIFVTPSSWPDHAEYVSR